MEKGLWKCLYDVFMLVTIAIIGVVTFGMDLGSQSLLLHPDYYKDLAINLLFPYQTPRDVSGKLINTDLSPKDRILHFFIYKVLFLLVLLILLILWMMKFSICGLLNNKLILIFPILF